MREKYPKFISLLSCPLVKTSICNNLITTLPSEKV